MKLYIFFLFYLVFHGFCRSAEPHVGFDKSTDSLTKNTKDLHEALYIRPVDTKKHDDASETGLKKKTSKKKNLEKHTEKVHTLYEDPFILQRTVDIEDNEIDVMELENLRDNFHAPHDDQTPCTSTCIYNFIFHKETESKSENKENKLYIKGFNEGNNEGDDEKYSEKFTTNLSRFYSCDVYTLCNSRMDSSDNDTHENKVMGKKDSKKPIDRRMLEKCHLKSHKDPRSVLNQWHQSSLPSICFSENSNLDCISEKDAIKNLSFDEYCNLMRERNRRLSMKCLSILSMNSSNEDNDASADINVSIPLVSLKNSSSEHIMESIETETASFYREYGGRYTTFVVDDTDDPIENSEGLFSFLDAWELRMANYLIRPYVLQSIDYTCLFIGLFIYLLSILILGILDHYDFLTYWFYGKPVTE